MKLLFLRNDLLGAEYAEVYAGGASVALALLFEEFASHIHINDLNSSVHTFWHVALTQPEELVRRVMTAPLTTTEWERQREIQRSGDGEEVDLAFATFYLNRTSRSGILGGGIIGGKSQRSEWKIDARFNRMALARRIEKIGRFSDRITLTQMDGAEYIRDVVPSLPFSLVYMDPPYFDKGQHLYQNFYLPDDHAHVARLVQQIESHHWIVSYDAAPDIMEFYSGYTSLTYQLGYSANSTYKGNEVMFFSPDLSIPTVPSPANLPTKLVHDERARRAT